MNIMHRKATVKPITCLIVCRQALVAMDLEGAITERFVGARVLLLDSLSDATDDRLGEDPVCLAFVEAGPQEIAGTGLERRIVADGGRILLMGGDAEEAEQSGDWPVLQRPFDGEVLSHWLGRIGDGEVR